ncbi:MAG TPA: heterodisulfide reductase-related iron-sulfur binding cluster [Pirellulales bacterium]|nr:heterodisulfide reductase-related iron-sulfur binding cluster [Pirellulales bacterium]
MNDPLTATREVFWNITHVWVMYALLLPTVAVAGYGVFRRVRVWRRGQPENRFDQPARRIAQVGKYALLQLRTWRKLYPGVMHAMIFWGFIVLTIATTVVMLDYDFGIPIMHGYFYLLFQSFITDVFGALAIIGIGMAMLRRWGTRPRELVYTREASLILVAVLVILVSGFLVEGWRIAATADPWAAWSPFGNLVARASAPFLSEAAMQNAHRATWWLHMALVFGFLAWAPYTKMVHILTSTLNIYTARLAPIGANLRKVDFESEEKLGIHTLAGFTWKDLLDFDACTECGRCTAACPAHRVGKELSPRDIILDLQRLTRATNADFSQPFIGATAALSVDAMWECTTCGACVEACPVLIEQMPKIVDTRRFLVMEEADFPETMQQALTSVETRAHPFRGTAFSRVDWAQGLPIATMAEAREAEVLLWVGCGGALVERNQKIVRSLAQLLAKAGVKFAILGREEKCTGDPARRIGNEFLFQQMAEDNIATLDRYQTKTIVTSCPHCFNTLRNEYPQFGGHYEVFHHSEYLARLVQDGKLVVDAPTDKKITFHDPCYLGRHNGVYDAPRELVQISSSYALIEMAQSRQNGFCCGGGGGMSFIDEPADKRVNQERARQVLETDADIVAVGCPFCTTMLEDGINAKRGDREIQVLDVAELLWQAVERPARSDLS